ncbi:hypothetical protein ACIO3O_35760 [Streptomyces sp. NPDC087440]|uniref:hypothetical protein n=1 Tax=Streptomyces sp. NPDC087440 TaxID=3365790 RepID=UPI00381B25E5
MSLNLPDLPDGLLDDARSIAGFVEKKNAQIRMDRMAVGKPVRIPSAFRARAGGAARLAPGVLVVAGGDIRWEPHRRGGQPHAFRWGENTLTDVRRLSRRRDLRTWRLLRVIELTTPEGDVDLAVHPVLVRSVLRKLGLRR